MLKTPLRYPGGKSKAIKQLSSFINLSKYDEYREPFLGGGSVFLWLKQTYSNKRFWINDLYFPLFCFWKTLQTTPKQLMKEISFIKENNIEENYGIHSKYDAKNRTQKMKNTFLEIKDKIKNSDEFWTAVYFYVINKCSFSGLSEIGTFSPQASISNFSISGIEKLDNVSKLLQDVKITNNDYSFLLNETEKNVFLFLDPPYDIDKKSGSLYGKNGLLHKHFDHQKFSNDVLSCSLDFGITYNDNDFIRKMFSSCNIREWEITYTMRQKDNVNKKRKELFISR